MHKQSNANTGFTLAELLIALAILGVIATFTIPKVIFAQQNQENSAAAKEALAMVAGAYQSYLLSGRASSSTTMGDFTQYMNYVKVETSGVMDDHVGYNASFDCSTLLCLRLHSGAVIYPLANNKSFGGTATTNAILIYYDPDGQRANTSSDVAGKSLAFFVYYNGAITSRAKMKPGTADSSGTHSAVPTADPSWFSW